MNSEHMDQKNNEAQEASQNVRVHFLGAAETVTGSRFLLETPALNILLDCGLFQGLKKLRQLNWAWFPVEVAKIDMVLLTHGHLDHVGFLPRLVKMGFNGKIYGTRPTLEVAEIILKDSAKIQEDEAVKANAEGYSKHSPARPLYDLADVEHTLPYFHAVPEGEWMPLSANIRARFQYVGHIVGATFVELDLYGKRFVFSGDVGRPDDPLMFVPKKPREADVLFVESTYGDKNHPKAPPIEQLKRIIHESVAKGGTIIIPSFAVERTQTLMYMLWKLAANKEIPPIPMIMDSPMGANVLDVFRNNLDWHRLSPRDCVWMCAQFHIVREYAETQRIIDDPRPKIVIAGSGMVNGGRVLSYLEHYISRPETTVILIGYQAEGTRGRKLLEGSDEIKFYGRYHPVYARIESINGLSAHADQHELIDWLSDIHEKPERVYIVHGEPHAADAFRVKLRDTLGWESTIPELYSIHEIPLGETQVKAG